MKKVIATVSVVLGLLIPVAAYAETPDLKSDFDYITGTLYVDGKITKAEQRITANMLVKGKTPEEAENSENIGENIVYCAETVSDENGNFGFEAKLAQDREEGKYTLYLGSKAFDQTENISIYFSDADTYRGKIEDLNGKSEYSDFKLWLDTVDGELIRNAEKIGFGKYATLTDKDTAAKLVYNYARKEGLSTTDARKNNAVFDSGYYASLIRNNVSLTSGWIEEILLKDSNIVNLYNKYGEKNLTFFLQKINKGSATEEELERNIFDALILTIVKYPDGNDNIKTVFEKYATTLGANTSRAVINNYAAIAGKDYADVATCVQVFNTSVAGNGSGTGGGNGGGVSYGGSGSGIFAGVSSNKTNELGIKFNDLNPVPWAYTAISALYEKNIVSGKSEENFCPNETVTREEFAKMLVCAAGLQDYAVSGNIFKDADDDAWYTKYINIAYANGICQGVADGEFGVGKTVTREDMCVMVYNTLRKLSINCPDVELDFADEPDFSEYSKASVASLANMGIVSGTGNGIFEPKGYATRAQAAVIIYNMINNVK